MLYYSQLASVQESEKKEVKAYRGISTSQDSENLMQQKPAFQKSVGAALERAISKIKNRARRQWRASHFVLSPSIPAFQYLCLTESCT